jgi:hypothetical protein
MGSTPISATEKGFTKVGLFRFNPKPAIKFSRIDLQAVSMPDGGSKAIVLDVFISYASEDKVDFVEHLVVCLEEYGLKVWYDIHELKISDSLVRKIDQGLAHSRYGVVILSRHFFCQGLAAERVDALFFRDVSIM